MNYEIIFYRCGQTAAIQQLCEKIFAPLDLRLSDAAAAADTEELGSMLSASLKRTRLIIVFGAIDSSGQSTEKLLSKILKPKKEKKSDSLKRISEDLKDCYYILSGEQMIMIIPDSPDELNKAEKDIHQLAGKTFSLNSSFPEPPPDPDKIDSDITSEKSITIRTPILPAGSTAEKRNAQKLSRLKIIIISLISLGVLELAAAAALFFLFNQ